MKEERVMKKMIVMIWLLIVTKDIFYICLFEIPQSYILNNVDQTMEVC